SSIRNMTSGASAIACTPRMVPLPEAVGRSDSVQAASKAVQSTAAIRRREVVVIVVLFIRRSAVAADRACGREFRPRGPAPRPRWVGGFRRRSSAGLAVAVDRLHFQELLQPVRSPFAPVPGLLVTPERRE